jgi:GntR family transcriptional regulator/MocR family aminotransferase
MKGQKGSMLLSTLNVDPSSGIPLYRQLEATIRQLVLDGKLSANSRLPATRQLALDLGISRLTVKNVYEQLTSEGFLDARRGAGTFVASISTSQLPLEIPAATASVSSSRQPILSQVSRIGPSRSTTHLGGVKAFRPGVPALDLFPRRAWASAHSRVMRQNDDQLLGYGPPGGMPELKRAIAEHVRDHRGVDCEAEQIIITSGAQQAFSLIALALLETGNTVWFEDPGHIAARDSMRLLGADVRSVPIDEEGFDLHFAESKYPNSALIFVTPSHQHPLGVTMSLNRRLELLDYAQQNNCWVVEDDYDSEFRYTGRALPALRALDHTGNVLYVGSFSKSLFPALRLGYLISPPSMVDAFTAGQTILSQNVSPVLQQVTARFILDGSFNSHIRKMRSAYQQRRDLLIESLTEQAGELLELETCEAGMHLIAWLRNRSVSDSEAACAIWDSGIDCLPVSLYCDQQKLRPGIMFGFACAAENAIAANTVQVARALESCYIRN